MKTITTLFLCVSLFLPILVSAESRYSFTELSRQQEATEIRLLEARRFVSEGSHSANREFYNHAFELLAQSSTRLDRADSVLEAQIDSIMDMRLTVLRNRNLDRDLLNEKRVGLRELYFEVNRLAQSLSRDIAPYIGINVDRVRWMMGNLRYLCENAADQGIRARACRLVADMERALEAGDLRGVKVAKAAANDLTAAAQVDLSRGGRDTTGPTAAPVDGQSSGDSPRPDSGPSGATTEGGGSGASNVREPTADSVRTAAKPSHLSDETVNWMAKTLEELCRETKDPELRRRVCEMKDELEKAVRDGDWGRVSDILNTTLNEVIPAIKALQPELHQRLSAMPVEVNGQIQYFPPDFSQPGVGTRYIGGRGSRLIEENEQFIALVGEGENARWDRRDGASREWRFSARIISETASPNGKEVGFRLEEERREGDFSGTKWKVSKEGRTVADGTGIEGKANLTDSGSYLIEFTGETDWNSPFRIETRVDVVL